ncbi:MAG: MBOAT family protein [Ruminococcus sp.]|uniref:MBOAT family O-acyltransferase n=1 Tax=Ruminococcus sp. TaxID=41978 RepID=UPI0025E2F8B4|nr:MBOAT family O-acyltransferase [Ruminococcus sp.]MBR5682370.1 MBOAT family protein [Ruminococcus sp.]
MVFSRLFFIYIFLPVCLLCYALARGTKHKNTVLIIFSLIFYAWGEPVYIFLMLATAVVNYAAALFIGKYQGRAGDTAATVTAVVYDLLMLGVFKYSGFIVENINALFSCSLPVPDIRLPIGISFYTFQTISYIIDCHWEKVKPQKSFKNFLLFLTLFPQLIAGPIVRYSSIEKEINERTILMSDVSYGLNRVALGLAKKVLLADQLSLIAESFLGNIGGSTMLGAWYGAIAYGMQIYFDFSGYSDIAIGLGRVFGFHFYENFDHPFMCKDITEFWQRWHISLGTFFRDYLLYIPIFGKRRKYGGLFLVWLCTGIWHGASWNYVIWGLYYGLFIFIELLIGKKKMKKVPVFIRHIYSKFVIIIGFAIFYFEDLGKLGTFFRTAFGFGKNGFVAVQDKISLVNNIFLIAVAVICCFPLIRTIKNVTDKRFAAKATISSAAAVVSALLLVITSIVLVDATTSPFLYYQF